MNFQLRNTTKGPNFTLEEGTINCSKFLKIEYRIRIPNEVLKSTRFKACNVIFATKRVSGTATTVDHIGFYLVEVNKTQKRDSERESSLKRIRKQEPRIKILMQ